MVSSVNLTLLPAYFFPFSPTQNTFQPHHVYVDGIGRLWVADTNNYRVLRFDNAATKANGANADGVLGQLDFTSDQGGTHPATWMTPTSVYVDGSGRLWVADQLNSRVLRFDNAATKANGADPDGVLGQPDFNIHLQITSDPLYQPVDITGDSTGRVFITTYTTGLHIFDNAAAKPNGAAADVTHDFSYSDLGCFFDPAADVLWVAGYGNRVLRFGVPSNPLSAPVISTPAAGAVITNPRPVITGTGEISATITVTEGATSICTAVVAADSTWTCTPGADLSLGAHTVSVTQTNAALRVSPAATRSFTVNPATPTATATATPTAIPTAIPTASPTANPLSGLVIIVPAEMEKFADTNVTISGTGDAGSTIIVTEQRFGEAGTCSDPGWYSGQSCQICTVTVDASNGWSCVGNFSINTGGYVGEVPHTITAQESDPSGLPVGGFSIRNFIVGVNPPPPPTAIPTATPTVTLTATPTATATAIPTATRTATPTATATATPTATRTATPTATATAIPTATRTATPTATATAIPTATRTATPTATATAIPTATRTATPTATATAIPTATPTASPTAIPPSAPVINAPVADAPTSNTRPKITGRGTAGMTLTVSEGTATICTATVSACGSWTCTPSADLAEGAHTISATQTDAALTVSPAVTRSFRVDTTPPSVPVVDGPATGGVVNSFRPTFSGTGGVGAPARITAITTAMGETVTVSEGTATICSATVAADGTWSCTATTDMANGAHTISITQIDAAGNSSAGVTRSITVDALYRIILPMINV